jgi:hypothetical protein
MNTIGNEIHKINGDLSVLKVLVTMLETEHPNLFDKKLIGSCRQSIEKIESSLKKIRSLSEKAS